MVWKQCDYSCETWFALESEGVCILHRWTLTPMNQWWGIWLGFSVTCTQPCCWLDLQKGTAAPAPIWSRQEEPGAQSTPSHLWADWQGALPWILKSRGVSCTFTYSRDKKKIQTLEDSYIYEILCLDETKMNLSKIIIFSSFILNAFLIVDHSKRSHSYYLSLTI